MFERWRRPLGRLVTRRITSAAQPNPNFTTQHEETDFFDCRCDHDFRGNGGRRGNIRAKIYLRHASGGRDGSTGQMPKVRDDAGGGEIRRAEETSNVQLRKLSRAGRPTFNVERGERSCE